MWAVKKDFSFRWTQWLTADNQKANTTERAYDISWIHFTHIENWYKKLGYKTVLKWNSDGIVMEGT